MGEIRLGTNFVPDIRLGNTAIRKVMHDEKLVWFNNYQNSLTNISSNNSDVGTITRLPSTAAYVYSGINNIHQMFGIARERHINVFRNWGGFEYQYTTPLRSGNYRVFCETWTDSSSSCNKSVTLTLLFTDGSTNTFSVSGMGQYQTVDVSSYSTAGRLIRGFSYDSSSCNGQSSHYTGRLEIRRL